VVLYVLLLLLTLVVWVVSDDMWSRYTQVGDLVLLFGFILFALWAWWYSEDRDRRRAANTARRNGEIQKVDGDGG
jgi:uncharacterized membrane protein